MDLSAHEVRKKLNHPVVDADGHWSEYVPVFAERMRKVAGNSTADAFLAWQRRIPQTLSLTIEQRRQRGIAMQGYWVDQTTNTLDRATAMLPRMLYERLDEFGIDFSIIYPTAGLSLIRMNDDHARRAVIRAFNIVNAEYFETLADRLTPAAIIPMHHPDEAVKELEFVTSQLGTKVCMFASNIPRRIPSVDSSDPDITRLMVTYDCFGIDSPYSYDVVWQKCRELKIAPTFHTGGRSFGLRNSPSNFSFNHIGHFAAAGHALAKGLFLGGVTRRFPDLRFAFLEGGATWGCQLFSDLIEHWERRGAEGLAHMDPRKLDRQLLKELVEKYGDPDLASELECNDGWPNKENESLTGGVPVFDDFAACIVVGFFWTTFG